MTNTNEMRLQGIGMVEGTMAGLIQVGDVLRWNFGSVSRVTEIEFSATGKTIICQVECMNSKGEIETYERKMRVTRLVNIVASGNTKLTSEYGFEIIPPVEEIKAVDMELIFEDAETVEVVEAVEEGKDLKYYQDKLERAKKLLISSFEMGDNAEMIEDIKNHIASIKQHIHIKEYEKPVPKPEPKPEPKKSKYSPMQRAEYDVRYAITETENDVIVKLIVEDITNKKIIVDQVEAEFNSLKDAEPTIVKLKKQGAKVTLGGMLISIYEHQA